MTEFTWLLRFPQWAVHEKAKSLMTVGSITWVSRFIPPFLLVDTHIQ